MAVKHLRRLIIGALALLACTPVYVVNNNDKEGGFSPKNTSLLEMCDKIQEDWEDKLAVSRIYVCAHRANTVAGARKGIPENSVPNILQAIESGADMVELDVRTTKDGVLVLMHDATVDATVDKCYGNVSDLTLAEIQSHDMKQRGGSVYRDEQNATTKVPTLLEALQATKDRIYVNLDLSNKNNSPQKVLEVIYEAGVEDQVMLYAGNDITEYQRLNPLVAVHPYIGNVDALAGYSGMIGAKLFQYSNAIYLQKKVEAFGKQVHLKGCLSYSNLLDSYDQKLRDGDYSPLDAFIESGSDFVQTDVAELVTAYLDAKGLR